MSADQTVSTVVRMLQAQRGDTQTTIGKAVGLSHAQVSRRMTGQQTWKVSELDALAAYWDVPVTVFLTDPRLIWGPGRAATDQETRFVRRLPVGRPYSRAALPSAA